MKKDLIKKIEELTGCNNLKKMSWQQVVDNIILPKMAGQDTRTSINDMYMNFMADYAYDVYCINKDMANVLFEVALQRLSCGAVMYSTTYTLERLHQDYWSYSSLNDEPCDMTEGCYNFIMKASEICLKYGNEVTKLHTLEILLELINRIFPGEPFDYDSLGEFINKAEDLYKHSEKLVEQFAPYEMLYINYSKPDQWKKHKIWFAKNLKNLRWRKFFEDTNCLEGNFVQRRLQLLKIKDEIKHLSKDLV